MTSTNQPTPAGVPPQDGPPPTIDFGGEAQAEQLVKILDQYLADLKAGRPVDRASLLAQHPELASQLEACLAGLEFIQGAEGAGTGPGGTLASRRVLGDFRILREVGRGGMGAVYEAEQISLGRRVALKVLRFAGVTDPEALDRFRREAETVARLHHTNIVPIFAVGCDQGVNFYAMQFIEGRSLAEVGTQGVPLAVDDVLQWGLQAAEALAHAHERHVIHRDVKPSNLLLDNEGRLWLTDFGLARRLDDVTLSMTGALLGTPRYMSPEQASATRQQVDRRTDIYSLGATLYELLGGRPAFTGDTPHRVIQQILSTEPTPLRNLRPDLPRDVETVVMKCLSKEASQRYDSARDLADDLRACLEQRPIRARRANFVEQAARWLRGHQQGARLMGAAVAGTLLVVASIMLGLRWYDAWRQVHVMLTTTEPPLTVELFEPDGHSVATVALPMEKSLDVPDGEYELRVSSSERWSQTLRTSFTRGESVNREVDLEGQQLWSPTLTPRWWSVVDDRDGAALLLWNDEGVVCQSGFPKKRRWTATFLRPRTPALDDVPGLLWPWFGGTESAHAGAGPTTLAPVVAERTVDVNRDGVGDILVAARHQAFVLALSGENGSVLWCAALGDDVRRAHPQSDESSQRTIRSSTIGDPLIVNDYDQDGVPDLVVTSVDAGDKSASEMATSTKQGVVPCRRVVQLLSGAKGKPIWTRELPDAWFDLEVGERAPSCFQWLVGVGYGVSSSMVGGNAVLRRHYIRSGQKRLNRNGMHAYVPDRPRLVTIDGESRLALVAGRYGVWIDVASGELRLAEALSERPVRPASWADVDGDRSPDLVFVSERPVPAGTTSQLAAPAELHVWNSRRKQSHWKLPLGADVPESESWTLPPPTWPLVTDLDGDGRAEVLAPDGSSAVRAMTSFVEVPWGGLVLLDGDKGIQRWKQRIVSSDQRIERFAVGPDLDGDGTRDVFVASLSGNPVKLHVEARSGKTGTQLWLSTHSLRTDSRLDDRTVATPMWWNAGEDGWPQLVVSVHGDSLTPMQSDTIILSAATGRLTHKRRQVAGIQVCDVDHDGVEDLIAYQPKDLAHPEDGGNVDCLRGVVEEPWNRHGPVGVPEADFNGDGVIDLVGQQPTGTAVGMCGRTGERLWSTRLTSGEHVRLEATSWGWSPNDNESEHAASTKTRGDVDGDGVVDVMFWLPHGASSSPLGVLSGRTGRILWRAVDLPVHVSNGVADFRAVDVDADGTQELAVILLADLGYDMSRLGMSSDDLQLWLLVFSGSSGNLRWKIPLSCAYGMHAPADADLPTNGSSAFPSRTLGELVRLLTISDVNNDGRPELLVPSIDPGGTLLKILALRGDNGDKLWERALPPAWRMQDALLTYYAPRAVDLDRDGKTEVVVWEEPTRTPATASDRFIPRLSVLEGATGSVLRQYEGAERRQEYQSFQDGERRGVSDLVLLRGAEGKRIPAVVLTGPKPELMLCHDSGQATNIVIDRQIASVRLWCCDVDGDQVDELALVADKELRVFSPSTPNAPLWKRGDSADGFERIVAIHSDESNGSIELVAMRASARSQIVGLDARTGAARWMCVGPGSGWSQLLAPRVLGRDESALAPLVLYQRNFASYCRRGRSWLPSTTEASSANIAFHQREPDRIGWTPPAIGQLDRFTPVSTLREVDSTMAKNVALAVVPPRHDPRWARDVPWVQHAGSSSELISFLKRATLFAIALILLPLGIGGRMVRRRQWNLRAMFTLTAVVALASVVATSELFSDGRMSRLDRWWHALFATPPVWFLWRVAVWGFERRWRTIGAWVGMAVGFSLLLAGFQLLLAMKFSPLEPEEYYVADNWYLIFDVGFYVITLVAIPVVPLLAWIERRRNAKTLKHE